MSSRRNRAANPGPSLPSGRFTSEERRAVSSNRTGSPRAPQGAWGNVAKAAAAVKDLSSDEVGQLKTLLAQLGIMDAPASAQAAPDAKEQAWLEAQMSKTSQTLEETAEGVAFFDNVEDARDAAMACAACEPIPVAGNPPSIAVPLPDNCDLDADFVTPQHGVGGWGYDGWVADEHKASVAYQVTRVLGSLPLPAFLVLAGAAVALRVDAARRRDEDPARVRAAVVRRGLTVVLFGYLTSLAYAAIDGFDGLDTMLRADVLHVIGLSIAALGWLGIRRDPRALRRAAVGLLGVPTALSPRLRPLGAAVSGPARYLVALFAGVPPVTRRSGWAGRPRSMRRMSVTLLARSGSS